MGFIHSLNGTIFIFTGELTVIHCLSNSFSRRYCNYFLEYSQASIHLTVLCIFLMLKFAAIQFGKRTFFQAYFTTPVTMKQTYYKSSYISRAELIIMKWKIFAGTFFQLMFRKSFFSRISNYSEYVLFRSSAYSEQQLFQKRNFFRDRYFLQKSLFLIVLLNQFHSI